MEVTVSNAPAGLSTMGYRIRKGGATAARVTAGVSEFLSGCYRADVATAKPFEIFWDFGTGWTASERFDADANPSGSGALPYTVKATTNGATPIVGVQVRLTAPGQTYDATTGGDGVATFGIDAGTYLVTATSPGRQHVPQSITVTAAGQTVITLPATSGIPEPANPDQTTAFTTVRDGRGAIVNGEVITFRLRVPGATADVWKRNGFTVTSGADGGIQTPLLKRTQYQLRTRTGEWVDFTTGSDPTFALPLVLGGDDHP